jgi:hypothetical protein
MEPKQATASLTTIASEARSKQAASATNQYVLHTPKRSHTRNLSMHNQQKSTAMFSIKSVLGIMALSLASFYTGLMLGMQSADLKCQQCLNESASVKSEQKV